VCRGDEHRRLALSKHAKINETTGGLIEGFTILPADRLVPNPCFQFEVMKFRCLRNIIGVGSAVMAENHCGYFDRKKN